MTDNPKVAKPMGRLHHIDSLRAYAILMMLQGHFIDTLIDPVYRVAENPLYKTWMFNKGFTAPIFFTVTGLVLVYLLFRKGDPQYREARAKKALKRGLELILWGYLLRTNIWGLLSGHIYGEFWKIDVLHCIGIGLIIISLLYRAFKHLPFYTFQIALCALSTLIFLFEPIYMAVDSSHLPKAIGNYLTRANGSVFTPFPWVGYTLMGGFIGTLYINHIHKKVFHIRILPFAMAAIGFFLMQKSSWLLMQLHFAFDVEVFKQVAYNNYLFIRLGHVLMFISGFIVLEKILARFHLFNEIGRSTLNIYIIHFVILYGSWTGLGLSSFFARSLSPLNVILGALLFIIAVTYLALNVPTVKAWIKEKKVVQAIQKTQKELLVGIKSFILSTYRNVVINRSRRR